MDWYCSPVFVVGFGPFRAVAGLRSVSRVEGSACVCTSPCGVCPAGELQWHFACGFDFGHSL